jgi:hypothetical protein
MIKRTGVLLAAVLAFSAANVEATLIDSFSAKSQSYLASRWRQSDSGQKRPGSDVAIGGYRDVGVRWISGGMSRVKVFADRDEPGFDFTEGFGQAIARLTWDGANSPDRLSFSLGADLKSGGDDDFLFDIGKVSGNGTRLKMTVYTSATHASVYTSVVEAGTSGDLKIPYSSFRPVGCYCGADFSHVGAIVLELSGVGRAGSDITINSIRTSAPEPSSLVLAAIGAIAFLGLKKRRRKV